MSHDERIDFVRHISDIRESIGFPLSLKHGAKNVTVIHPEELLKRLSAIFSSSKEDVLLEAFDGENEVLIETFLRGKEFSCIVIQDENGKPIALPPTEIRKGQELYDYRSKYLPGLSRKITPDYLPEEQIQQIADACCELFTDMNFNVYARIDGFITTENKVYLNDPNTTSGMLPSSFFFTRLQKLA